MYHTWILRVIDKHHDLKIHQNTTCTFQQNSCAEASQLLGSPDTCKVSKLRKYGKKRLGANKPQLVGGFNPSEKY